MRRALTLLVELGACQKRRPIIDVYARPHTPPVIGFRHARIARESIRVAGTVATIVGDAICRQLAG